MLNRFKSHSESDTDTWTAVHPHLNPNKDRFGVGDNRMWNKRILVRLLGHVTNFNHNKRLRLLYSRLCSLCSKSRASMWHLFAFSSSTVELVRENKWCGRANKQCEAMQNLKKCVFFPLGWDERFFQKRTKTMFNRHHDAGNVPLWLTGNMLINILEYSNSCRACEHLIWDIVSIRIWTLIGVCYTCKSIKYLKIEIYKKNLSVTGRINIFPFVTF